VSIKQPEGTAIVLGGGGVLGAVQVGMLRALIEAGVRPSLVVGTSVGALNGAVLAALPLAEVTDRLDALWGSPDARGLFAAGTVQRLRELARSGVAVHQSDPLRRALTAVLGKQRIEDLPVAFTCCAANIEDAAEYWFDQGLVVDAVLASAAVPGLLHRRSFTVGIISTVAWSTAFRWAMRSSWVHGGSSCCTSDASISHCGHRSALGRLPWWLSRSPDDTAMPAIWLPCPPTSRCMCFPSEAVARLGGTAARPCATAMWPALVTGSPPPTGHRRTT
jgi:hypothetical protein